VAVRQECAVPTNRRIIDRPRRSGLGAEAVALFIELNAIQDRRRHENLNLRAKEQALHEMLGLWTEWRCSCCSVLDRDRAPCWPANMPAHHDWHRVRAVREQLLQAVAMEPIKGVSNLDVL
jgi:hypothetical protein